MRGRLVIGNICSLAFLAATGCSPTSAELIGPRGGTVVSDDGRFALHVPEGALAEDVEIRIDAQQCEHPTAIGPCFSASPRYTSFIVPAVAVYELDMTELDPSALPPMAVFIRRRSNWTELADIRIDLEDGTIRGSAGYLSSFELRVWDRDRE